MNLALVLNVHLYKWKIKSNPLCSFCGLVEETMEHIFIECEKVKPLLKEIPCLYKQYTGKEVASPDLNKENILFNTIHKKPAHLLNFILLALKQYIYSTKCLNKAITMENFKGYVEHCRKCEYYNAKQTKKLNVYYAKWKDEKIQLSEIHLLTNFEHEYMYDIKLNT